MHKNSRQRILLILLGLWTFTMLIYIGWSLAKKSSFFNQAKIAQTGSAVSLMYPSASQISLTVAKTPTPQGGFATTNLTLTPPIRALPSVIFTSTPLPTLPPGTPPSPTPTRRRAHTKPPSYYYGLMMQLYQAMIGQWRGMASITVNRQSRHAQLILLEFYNECQMGQVCGKYHWENGCFGDLVLMRWYPKSLVFRNVEYSADASCKEWVGYVVQPTSGDTLYLSMGFRDQNKRWVSKGVTLRRR